MRKLSVPQLLQRKSKRGVYFTCMRAEVCICFEDSCMVYVLCDSASTSGLMDVSAPPVKTAFSLKRKAPGAMKVTTAVAPKQAKTVTTVVIPPPAVDASKTAPTAAAASTDKKSEYLQMLHKLEADVSGSDTSGKWLVR